MDVVWLAFGLAMLSFGLLCAVPVEVQVQQRLGGRLEVVVRPPFGYWRGVTGTGGGPLRQGTKGRPGRRGRRLDIADLATYERLVGAAAESGRLTRAVVAVGAGDRDPALAALAYGATAGLLGAIAGRRGHMPKLNFVPAAERSRLTVDLAATWRVRPWTLAYRLILAGCRH